MNQAIINGQIFDGDVLLEDQAVLLNGSTIIDLIPQTQLPKNTQVIFDLRGGYLVPGFIDLQVNGGGGVLFNNAPTVESLKTIGAAHRQYGTTGFLPTLITDSFTVMRRAIAAVTQAIDEAVPGVLGIHLEGPFLNPQRKGVHDAAKFCIIDIEGFDIITSLTSGKTLITLAPELTTVDMIKAIHSAGVIVSVGHSVASYDQVRQALAAGASGFTHLYNAMSPLKSRDPGIVGAALEDDLSWFGIIADGHHVHPAALSVAVAAKRQGGALLVTDAMATVGADNKSFELDGEMLRAAEGRIANSQGTLAGSDLDMISAVNNAAKFAAIDWFEAVRMASLYPARALGLDDQFGCIKAGYSANFVALDKRRKITHTWIQGEMRAHHPRP